MAAKVLYTQAGSDPTTIMWPPHGVASEILTLTSGTAQTAPNLVSNRNMLTYPDGRAFPVVTAAGSTIGHQRS